ncbi:MAG: hypothetical protein NT062_16875, partial [Proteobacteria bacterium]|nr:hypothetical protein [Pseudomonadota bacterium]
MNAATVALIALVPVVVLVLTSFVKLSIVLSLLRNALGTQDAPSSLVITGISLVLTMFVMAPVALDMLAAADAVPAVAPTPSPNPDETTRLVKALVPDESAAQVDAVKRALEPLRAWLGKHAAARDRETFVGLAANLKNPAKGDEIWVLAPAFLTTELREAFVIALI